MSKVNRFSLEERYNHQIRKVIYDRDADSDIELNNIYPIIDQLNKLDKQIADLEAKLEEIKNQTAIAELEKVKWFLVEKIEEKQSCFDSGNYNDFADGVKTICELMLISIDKQIKELGGVENVF